MIKLSDITKRRISLIKNSDEEETLKKHICPFFEKGEYPKCLTCKQGITELTECKEYYLERITLAPMDIWSEGFDKFVAIKREKTPLDEIVGVGVNCNSCYMFDKCPLYKEHHTCAIDWGKDKPKTAKDTYDFLIGVQYERVKRASVFEKIDGGVPDAGLSGEMDRLSALVAEKSDLDRERLSISVEASGSANKSTGGGLLASIFGKSSPAIDAPETKEITSGGVEYVEAIEIVEPEKVPVVEPVESVERKGRIRKRKEE